MSGRGATLGDKGVGGWAIGDERGGMLLGVTLLGHEERLFVVRLLVVR